MNRGIVIPYNSTRERIVVIFAIIFLFFAFFSQFIKKSVILQKTNVESGVMQWETDTASWCGNWIK